MSIGSRIKEARISLDFTQEELADKIGVTKAAIANYENELALPRVETLWKLTIALNCDANYLYQDLMKNSDDIVLSTHEKDLIKAYRLLDEDGKTTIDYIAFKK